MSAKLKQVIETIGELSADGKALLAHCLIASLETAPDDGLEDAWHSVAERRFQT